MINLRRVIRPADRSALTIFGLAPGRAAEIATAAAGPGISTHFDCPESPEALEQVQKIGRPYRLEGVAGRVFAGSVRMAGDGVCLIEPPAPPAGEPDTVLVELSNTLILKSAQDERRLVTGIVLAPRTPDNLDFQKDWYTAEEIEKAAIWFMANGRRTGDMHSKMLSEEQAIVVENWIERGDSTVIGGRPILKGTWLQTVWCRGDEVWAAVKSGARKAFSIGGKAMRRATGAAA